MSDKQAIDFEQAVALDPNYALAYTGLADTYSDMAFIYPGSAVEIKEYYGKAT